MDFRNIALGAMAALVLVSPALAQQGSGLDTPEMAEQGEAIAMRA